MSKETKSWRNGYLNTIGPIGIQIIQQDSNNEQNALCQVKKEN